MTVFDIDRSEFVHDDESPPAVGDVVSFNGQNAVVLGTSDASLQLQVMHNQLLHQFSDPRNLQEFQQQYEQQGYFERSQRYIQPMMPFPPPEPQIPHEWPTEPFTTRAPEQLEHSTEWYEHHGLALAKLMQLHKQRHIEPLHEIQPEDLQHLTTFAQMYATAKESGLFEVWDSLNLGQQNPFRFLEQDLSGPLPERLPRRIVLRRRPE